jgi:HAD superfamily hydrolase (TIGR01493 family)
LPWEFTFFPVALRPHGGPDCYTVLHHLLPHKVKVSSADIDALKKGILTMPAHPDVKKGLEMLKGTGFWMATLTNSPPTEGGKTPLESVGLAGFFERQLSVETARAYKPAQALCYMVAQELDVPPAACCMVAAHVWDTIGAQRAGLTAALLTRPSNAPLPVPGLRQPNVVAPDLPALPALAAKMIELWRPWFPLTIACPGVLGFTALASRVADRMAMVQDAISSGLTKPAAFSP